MLVRYRSSLFRNMPKRRYPHNTLQTPMLMVSLDRCSGSGIDDLTNPGDTYVVPRRGISVPLQCIVKSWGDASRGHMTYEHAISLMDHSRTQLGEQSE